MDIKKPEVWDIERLIPYEKNSKLHDPAQVKAIATSIKEFGWTTAIVVDRNGVIIAGHGRRLAAMKLGLQKVPVIVRDDLDDEQVRALRLADNRVALSGTDNQLLREELASLNLDLLDGIFTAKELDFFAAEMASLDTTAIVDDLDIEVANQEAETVATVKKLDEKDVPLNKAFGFKGIKARDEKYVAAWFAQIEAETGAQGPDALVAFARKYIGAAA